MVTTDFGKSGTILLFCGSINPPQYLAIGSGSGAAVSSLGSLVAELGATRKLWYSRDISIGKNITFIFDISSVAMSGINLREFGIGNTNTVGNNDLWMREGFPSITFDGSNELEIEVTFQTF